MSNENKRESDSNENDTLVELYKHNDALLVSMVTKLRQVQENTLMPEKTERINKVRMAVLNEDIKCQEAKMKLINECFVDISEEPIK